MPFYIEFKIRVVAFRRSGSSLNKKKKLRDVKYVHEESLKFVFEAIFGMLNMWLIF
jgi:hypothetical protein